MQHLLSNPITAFDFIMAGKSIITLKSIASGKHFTYRVKRAKDANIRFVSVLSNAQENFYQYIGMITTQGKFILTKGSKCSSDAPSFKAWNWAWSHLKSLSIPEKLEIWHEGRCGKCGRRLTDPTSIEIGLGPICRNK